MRDGGSQAKAPEASNLAKSYESKVQLLRVCYLATHSNYFPCFYEELFVLVLVFWFQSYFLAMF